VKRMPPIKLGLSYTRRVFSLEISNPSKAPIRIWSREFSYGYQSIYFQIAPVNGSPCLIKRKPARWTVNVPQSIVITSGRSHVERVDMTDGTWDVCECRSVSDMEIGVIAILEIASDENTSSHGILTGRYASNELRFRSLKEIATK
jgi:hypothetical protein